MSGLSSSASASLLSSPTPPSLEGAPDAPYSNSTPESTSAPHGAGGLFLVATPIGNLADFSERARHTLSDANLILCEDTRVTAKLLRHFGISTPTQTLHEHNEEERIPLLLRRLERGETIALVSDAGTPLLSDPGYRLTRAAMAAGLTVSGIPGPNAAALALTLSGLPPQPYMFLGFPPPRTQARRSAFASLRACEQAGLAATLIWYEAPHRLMETLEDLAAVFGGERPAAVGRELTKKFEEIVRGTVADLVQAFTEKAPRGEITILLGPPPENDDGAADLDSHLRAALQTHSVKDAATLVAGFVNLPRRTIYARALALSRDEQGQGS